MSKRKHSAHSGWVFSRSNDDTMRMRAFSSGTELKIGSNGNSGSFGKYICVTRRVTKEWPNTERWMWAGRQALWWLPQGLALGLLVLLCFLLVVSLWVRL